MASSGAGMGYFFEDPHNIPVFVRYTTPGDTVSTRLIAKEKLYFTGELLHVIEPAPNRIEPRCKYFATCGACDWLHLPYDEQILEKKKILEYIMTRSNLAVPVTRTIPAKQEMQYKCKVRFPGDGFSMRGSNTIIKIDECGILNTSLREILPRTHKKDECWGLDELSGKAVQDNARYIVEDDIVLAYSPKLFVQSNFEMNKELVKFIGAKISSLLLDNVDSQKNEIRIGMRKPKRILELFSGNGNFTLGLLKRGFDVVAVEGEQYLCHLLKQNLNENLYVRINAKSSGDAKNGVELENSTSSLSAHSSLGLHEPDRTKKANWGYLTIEHAQVLKFLRDQQKLAESQNNAPSNSSKDATNLRSTTPNEKQQRLPYDCLLLDPPRAGMGSSSAKLVTRAVARVIVYVSCDADSLSQDLRVLVKNGFRIDEQILIDMFPHTSHFETVTILTHDPNFSQHC